MLKEEIIANKGYAVFCVKEDDQPDEIAVRVLKQDCPDFLLPFKTMSIDGNMEFRYELSDGVRMSYQLPRMSRKELIRQMVSLLLPFKNCGDWLLDYHCLLLDPQYIFLNAKDQTVRYVYLPVRSYRMTDKEIKDFFIKFVLRVELQDDKDFLLQILRLLQEEDTSLLSVLEFLQNEMEAGRPPVRPAAPVAEQRARSGVREEKKEPENPSVKPENRKSENRIAEILNPILNKNTSSEQEKPADNLFEKSAEQPVAASGSGNKFGQANVEERLLQNLYGSAGVETKADKKNKKEKKKEKIKDKEKTKGTIEGQETKKGLFDGFFGKKKEKQEETRKLIQSGGDSIQPEPVQNNGGSVQPEPVYTPAEDMAERQKSLAMEDTTEMAGEDYEENNLAILRLYLENEGGYTAPRDIELNLEKGYVTVGRYDKSGYPCADYNFDHSLTFVSRNHFRIELRQDGYKIIDLDSKNGTLLNGKELVKNMAYPLKSGDIISISRKVRLTYRVM